jgi:type IV pilus assembly protein PilF
MVGCTASTVNRPTNPERALDSYIQLGRNYLAEGERDQARLNLLRALDINNRSPDANNLMGLLHETEGEIGLAKQRYQRALSADRAFTPARMNLARVLFAEGEFREAREQYRLSSQDIGYRLRDNAFFGMAIADLRLGNGEAAKESLRRALLLNPAFPSALLEVADIAFQERDYPMAREYLLRFEEVAPETARSLDLGARLAQFFGEVEVEQSYLMALEEMFPQSREALQRRLENPGRSSD